MATGVDSVVTWFQRTVPWSNTPRAWLERSAFLGIVLAAAILLVFGRHLSLPLSLVAWAGLVVVFGFLVRQGWVFVFGPVLFYDLVRSARRTRTYVIRFLYILLLFLVLCWMYLRWMDQPGFNQNGSITSYSLAIAQLTELYFTVFLSVQLTLVILLTPAYVAGAISDEKERKTIEYILATDLRNREIVLGKFVSRLLHLTVLILAGLPILSAVQFMGGIDPNLVLAGFAGTGLTMLSLAGLSIFASTVTRKTRDAILLVYVALLTYAGLWGVAEFLAAWATRNARPGFLVDVLDAVAYVFRVGNPAYAMVSVKKGNFIDPAVVWAVLQRYAVFHTVITVLTVWGSILLLRRSALAEPRQPRAAARGRRRRFSVGNYPMIWKEVFAERGFRMHILLRILFVVLVILSLLPLLFILYYFATEHNYARNSYYGYGVRDSWDMLHRDVNGYFVRPIGMLVGVLGLIGVAVRAATSVRGERDRDTLDALLTSPMSSEEILFGKWLGSILSVRWVVVWLLCIWFIGVLTGGMNLLMLPLLVMSWLVYAGAAASLGLWYSVTSRSSLVAILWTLFIGLAISSGHWIPTICCGTLGVFKGGGDDAVTTFLQIQMGLTPEVVLAMLPFRSDEFFDRTSREWVPIKLIIFAMGGTFCWAIFAWGAWQATNERFKRLTFRGRHTRADPLRRPTLVSSWPDR